MAEPRAVCSFRESLSQLALDVHSTTKMGKWAHECTKSVASPLCCTSNSFACAQQGDQQFRTGAEAAEMLLSEALRKDPHSTDFLESLQDMLPALAPVFDRAPKYAWIAKQLLEPERAIQFRVAWLDDNGNRQECSTCLRRNTYLRTAVPKYLHPSFHLDPM